MKKLLAKLAMALGLATVPGMAQAALTFTLKTGGGNMQPLIVDTNKCPVEGPTAQYVGGTVTNIGTTATNITATMQGFNGNVFLAGGDSATKDIGTLAAGESVNVYWFVSYVCTAGATANTNIVMTSSAGVQTRAIALTVRPAISANAGGNVQSATLGPGAVVGQTVYFDAVYGFGGASAGYEYFLQPSGSPEFNAGCFRLTGSEIISSMVDAFNPGDVDKMYGVQIRQRGGSSFLVSVRYYFQYLCASTSTVARPYAVQTSGSTNIKYTGNFDGAGSVNISYPGATNPFTITKTVDPPVGTLGLGIATPLTYTVTVENPSPHDTILDRIVDTLPPGITFNSLAPGSDVTALNSSSIPTAGAEGTITFRGKLGSSYVLPANGSVKLIYRANRPPTPGTFTNTAQGVFGQATTPTASATYNQGIFQPLGVTKVSSMVSDPVRGSNNPLAIPGGVTEYLISLTNPNLIPMDADSVVISDPTPPQLKMCIADMAGPGSGPIAFAQGSTSSGLSYTYTSLGSATDNVEFSNNGGANWGYTPVADSEGCDGNLTNFRVKPSGSFAAMGSFSLRARYRIR